ncbi:DUF5694 domain-containing protein [Exiguobacterium aestuarii]|uniref:DUF5694 domain-containing protein n=1 Tax=Exiguobacterium aestuarii TaxID=273527 RepID=A0ABW2PQA5_9BACL|nr:MULTISPECIES: DUF5694 domain-containing protein [Exiguobacterium]MCT4784808.1 DUF5694 domain-containing protein [Exiguobacterium aestuarii]
MNKTDILLVGTTHLNMPNNGDLFMPDMADVLSEDRQLEIKQFVNQLVKFKPTKVCVEMNTSKKVYINEKFQRIIQQPELATANEREQIAYRLAQQSNLDCVYPIDWNEEEGYSLATIIQEQQHAMDQILSSQQEVMNHIEKTFKNSTISDYYKEINHPTVALTMHRAYLEIASLEMSGTRWVSHYWYFRNLMIFKELMSLRESNERIFVLYGLGHIHLLKQFLNESGLYSVHDLNKYLL